MIIDDEQIECFACGWAGLVREIENHELDPDLWQCPLCERPVSLPEGKGESP